MRMKLRVYTSIGVCLMLIGCNDVAPSVTNYYVEGSNVTQDKPDTDKPACQVHKTATFRAENASVEKRDYDLYINGRFVVKVPYGTVSDAITIPAGRQITGAVYYSNAPITPVCQGKGSPKVCADYGIKRCEG